MPNPLTAEERARLLDELNWLAQEQVSFGAARIIQEARAELARTADDAREVTPEMIERAKAAYKKFMNEPEARWDPNQPMWERMVPYMLKAALASSKSEAAEEGWNG